MPRGRPKKQGIAVDVGAGPDTEENKAIVESAAKYQRRVAMDAAKSEKAVREAVKKYEKVMFGDDWQAGQKTRDMLKAQGLIDFFVVSDQDVGMYAKVQLVFDTPKGKRRRYLGVQYQDKPEQEVDQD